MILGILDKDKQGTGLKQILLGVIEKTPQGKNGVQPELWSNGHLAFCSIPLNIGILDEPGQPFSNEQQTIILMFQGKIYNIAEIRGLLGQAARFKTNCSGEALVHLYEKYQENFLDKVNGKFAFALWDKEKQRLLIGRDRVGIESLFYFNNGGKFIFSSSLKAILKTGLVTKQLNYSAILQYLLYCYNPDNETLVSSIFKLPPGHFMSIDYNLNVSLVKYWHLSFAETKVKTEEKYCDEILGLIQDAIRIRLIPQHSAGIFLSGGTDSSAIASITSTMVQEPLYTFSFRCQGKSFDESHYARLIATRYHTSHTEVPYTADSLKLISKAVAIMDEPFCDIGIEIGTFLLGQAAEGKVSYVLSGEGGDELFAGHPVYIADKSAALLDRLPRFALAPFLHSLQQLPDTDQKKDLKVKLKRFAYSMSFPHQLLSHRWRIYYTPEELEELCTKDFIAQCNLDKIFISVLKINSEADGKDQLSRSLYSDYKTLVSFYLQRLRLLRAFSLENHLPLLDHRLIEYAATVPSKFKIRGFSDTKYIYRKALTKALPREILYNRPKLGHSIPMKNWLRNNEQLKNWVTDILSDGSFKNRGFFKSDFIQRMLKEHIQSNHNYSHRLWGLIVLELWLRKHI